MSYVFISHVEEDQDIAKHIANELEAADFKAWYYERDSIPGPSYLTQILDAIEESAAIIVIISKDSIGSWQVDKEVIQVHECGKPFIPLLKGITHAEFRRRKPDWAMAMGAATSTPIPPEGVASIMPRVIAGLRWVGIPNATGVSTTPAQQPAQAQPTPQPAEPHDAPASDTPIPVIGAAAPAQTAAPALDAAPAGQGRYSGPVHAQPVTVVQPQPTVLAPNARTVKQSVKSWEWQHSLWMLWLIPLGFLSGIAFLWTGYRMQERRWVVYGFLYLLPSMLFWTVGLTNGTFLQICFVAVICVFIGSAIHAFRIRHTYLWRLQQMQSAGLAQL